MCADSLRPGTQLTVVGPPGQGFVEPSCGLRVATHPVIDLVEEDRVASRVIEDLPVRGDQVIRQPQLAHEDRDLGEPRCRGGGCRRREARRHVGRGIASVEDGEGGDRHGTSERVLAATACHASRLTSDRPEQDPTELARQGSRDHEEQPGRPLSDE